MFGVPNRNTIILTIDDNLVPLDPSWMQGNAGITIISSFTQFCPLIEIELFDRAGIMSEFYAISGGETIGIQYAVEREELNEEPFEFVISHIEEDNLLPSSVQGNIVKIHGLHGLGGKLFRPQKNRAFLDSLSSDVAEEIADEIEALKFIEKTEDEQTWIQANWTNAQMLRHVGTRAITGDGSGSFFYGLDKDGRLIYYSGNGLYRQPVTRRYRYSNNPDEFDDEGQKAENQSAKFEILYDFGVYNDKELMGTTGGYGSVVQKFDYEGREFFNEEFTASELIREKLSDRIVVKREEEDAFTRTFRHGRFDDNQHDEVIAALGYDNVFRRVGSAVKLWVIVRGDNTIRIGERVEIKIPDAASEKLFNAVIDQTWIIERVIDHLSTEGHYTKLVLSRDGVNDGGEDVMNLQFANQSSQSSTASPPASDGSSEFV